MISKRKLCEKYPPNFQQSGQALIEFLVVCLALIPLFLIVPMIAKYQDISNATEIASRYVAFEAITHNDSTTAWKPEAQLAQEVRRRFFSNSDSAIKTNDSAGNFKASQNLFWRGPKDESLISSINDDVVVNFGEARGATHQSGFTKASDGKPFIGTKDLLSLEDKGIYRANVSVKLANLPAGISAYAALSNINLKMERSTSVLLNHWAGHSSTQVQNKLDNNELNPVMALKELTPTLELIPGFELIGSSIRPPNVAELDFWEDTVPSDRLTSP